MVLVDGFVQERDVHEPVDVVGRPVLEQEDEHRRQHEVHVTMLARVEVHRNWT